VTINSKGELSAANFEFFGFDETGRDFNKVTVPVHP
jgi:hypothetical protein